MDHYQLRQELAACIRMLEYLGLIDFSGHVSARIPGGNEVLINSRDQSRCTVKPEDLIKVDLEGKLLEGSGVPPLEVFIHTEVYKARPDVTAVTHIHPSYTTNLSIAGKPFLPVIYHGAIFGSGVQVYDDCRHVNTPQRGKAMTEALGLGRAVVIRGHGATVAADSVKGAFFASVYLEDNAKQLWSAYCMGEPQGLKEEELAEGPHIWRPVQFDKVWTYYAAKAGINF